MLSTERKYDVDGNVYGSEASGTPWSYCILPIGSSERSVASSKTWHLEKSASYNRSVQSEYKQ